MRLRNSLIVAGLVVLLVSFGFAFSKASAGSGPKAEAVLPQSPSTQNDNENCFYCHSREGFTVELKSGETLPLTINPDLYQQGVHGSNDVSCTTCHTDIKGYPHPERTMESLRDVKLKYYTSCQQCHSEQFNLTLDSVHQKALAAGNSNAAVCADCHNPHTQQRLTNKDTGKLLDYARLQVPKTCAQCHSAIYDKYKESVHGKALTQEGNLDVPTCIDCHGVHNIQNPTTATFRNSTPYLCAKCHTNNALMHKYGLSTNVLNTYVADFHGTTVVLFDKTYPDQPTNKPVCTDCHGVHDIVKADDPAKGLAVRENLLIRCQKCHPGATANFPSAWMSHYIPSPEKYPIVYYVNLFYKFFIPAVLGPMAILVVMDFGRLMINRARRKKPVSSEEPMAAESKIERRFYVFTISDNDVFAFLPIFTTNAGVDIVGSAVQLSRILLVTAADMPVLVANGSESSLTLDDLHHLNGDWAILVTNNTLPFLKQSLAWKDAITAGSANWMLRLSDVINYMNKIQTRSGESGDNSLKEAKPDAQPALAVEQPETPDKPAPVEALGQSDQVEAANKAESTPAESEPPAESKSSDDEEKSNG